ncbi:MAG TPA: hypothetical protein VI756_31960 [Blastocatellia bacterium]
MLEASTGNPAPASVPSPQEIGAEIGQSVRAMGPGQMTSIAEQVSQKGLGQAGAVDALQSAVKAVGKDSITITAADGRVAVAGVRLGENQPVIIVNKAGQAVRMTADTSVKVINGRAVFGIKNIRPLARKSS